MALFSFTFFRFVLCRIMWVHTCVCVCVRLSVCAFGCECVCVASIASISLGSFFLLLDLWAPSFGSLIVLLLMHSDVWAQLVNWTGGGGWWNRIGSEVKIKLLWSNSSFDQPALAWMPFCWKVIAPFWRGGRYCSVLSSPVFSPTLTTADLPLCDGGECQAALWREADRPSNTHFTPTPRGI